MHSVLNRGRLRVARAVERRAQAETERFRAEAVDVFRVIAEMFSLGHSAQDVMETLGKNFPLTAAHEADHYASAPFRDGGDAPFSNKPQREPASDPALADTALRLAAALPLAIGHGPHHLA